MQSSKTSIAASEINNMSGSKNELVALDHIVFQKGRCSQRTKLEKALLVVSTLLVIGVVCLLVLFLVSKQPGTNKDVCLTEECVNVASMVSEAIDYSVHPCDDFYEFACGNWKKKNIIPEDKASYGTIDQLFHRINVDLKNAFEKKNSPDDPEAVIKARRLYASCINIDRIRNRGLSPILDFIDKVNGWPVIDPAWSENNFDLVTVMKQITLYNNFNWDQMPLFSIYVKTDSKQSSKNVLYIEQPSFGIEGQKYYLNGRNDTLVQAYEQLAIKTALIFGADQSTAEKDMRDILDFEINLAKISDSDETMRNFESNYNRMNISHLNQIYPQFNWLSYFQGIFGIEHVNINITESEPIINLNPNYFSQLFTLLSKTTSRVISNYLSWRIVQTYIEDLTNELEQINVQYTKILLGNTESIPRWQKCAEYGVTLKMATGRLFVDETFDRNAKKTIMEMIENLRSAFKEQLETNEWMDGETRIAAREKADAMSVNIGYPDEILNNTYLDTLYRFYSYGDDYFENILETEYHESVKNLKLLREPVKKKSWGFSPATANANYYMENYMEFPAAFLQPRFYSKTFPKSINYGGIGLVIGHEITHGFDDKGRQFDKNGNLRQWWTDESIYKFKKRAQCVVDQYSNYTVSEIGLKMNGINTQGENIADMGGIKQTFKAYRRWIEMQGKEEPLLPGLNFTHDQLLFINFAQLFCVNMRAEDARKRILTEQHTPNKFRIIGACQNSEDFSQSFNCPVDSYMNPKDKCSVW